MGQASFVDGLPCANSFQEQVPREEKGPIAAITGWTSILDYGIIQHKESPGKQEEVGYYSGEQGAEDRLSSL